MGHNAFASQVLWVIHPIALSIIAPTILAAIMALALAAEMVTIAPARLNGEVIILKVNHD